MKKIIYILIAFFAVAFIASCVKEEPVTSPSKKLSVVSSKLSFECTGGIGNIIVEAEEAVTATSDKDWAQVSVDGKTITVTCGEWTMLESRNAKITIKSGKESLDITAIQKGVVFYFDDLEMTEIAACYAKASEADMKFYSSAPITAVSSTVDWLEASLDNAAGIVNLKTKENTGMGTRLGTFIVQIGSTSKEFTVAQLPHFVATADWKMAFSESTSTSTKYNTEVKADHGYYYVEVYSVASFSAYNMTETEFLEMIVLPSMLEKLAAEYEYYKHKYGYDSFMSNKSTTWTLDYVDDGDYVGFMVGFDKNGFPTGYYSRSDIHVGKVEVVLTPYQKWIGSWKLAGKNIEGNAYEEVVEIMADPEDVDENGQPKETSLIIHGLCSKNQEGAGVPASSNYGDMYLKFDPETASITFVGQNGKNTFTSATQGEGAYMQLISMYVKAGATSYTNVTGGTFMRLTLNDDGVTTKIEVLDRSEGLPYKAFRMRLLNAKGSAYTVGGNAATISLEGLTFTKQ